MYRLRLSDGPVTTDVDVPPEGLVMGRADDCSLVLDDRGISRQHARVCIKDGRLVVEDLRSKNGTRVNGSPVQSRELGAGDVMEVGRFKLEVTYVLGQDVELSDGHVELERSVTVHVGELAKQWQESAEITATAQTLAHPTQVMRVLNHAAQTLVGSPPTESVLEHVLEVVFDHVPAERGFILLLDPQTGAPVPMAARYRTPDLARGQVSISRTLVNHVVANRVAIVTSDAAVDGRFQSRHSIMLNAIRSAMVAPLWRDEEVMGVIHVDCSRSADAFDRKHLDLLCAMANYAAVAVERARLHQRAQVEERHRERLRRFLSPQVASRVLSADEGTQANLSRPESREVTILFADLVGFTAMAETLSPEQLGALLNDYLSAMTEEIFRYDGTLDKYIGDAIMAVFGAPLNMEDHAERAVRAALAMRDRLVQFNTTARETPTLVTRVGINTGRVVAGEIGSINKREYTVLGDPVNVASRLESSVAMPGQIVIGEETYTHVKTLFQCDNLGARPVKGRRQEVTAYQVLGPLVVPPSWNDGTGEHTPR